MDCRDLEERRLSVWHARSGLVLEAACATTRRRFVISLDSANCFSFKSSSIGSAPGCHWGACPAGIDPMPMDFTSAGPGNERHYEPACISPISHRAGGGHGASHAPRRSFMTLRRTGIMMLALTAGAGTPGPCRTRTRGLPVTRTAVPPACWQATARGLPSLPLATSNGTPPEPAQPQRAHGRSQTLKLSVL
jgi:hypothetical protein